ncbi:hypothetical protein BC939DRAFT_106578 [Gamsiella multidivaricata]|uniref:uncharacterized protein n=1 Tax=Gamsiella multidivaricata TaxID=101098 RepID=UPI002220BA5F|nr:uncharacterized protein BC939DRAFT_106578 [Gamsiella multidivaricata]KAG0370516.1 hypothetical protein BGZ54_006031 [Gamsiella multidivaricata]KAI7826880.1 hypothetical protein BC939DRAFT_106578 [Gamsiella multidivaricata]
MSAPSEQPVYYTPAPAPGGASPAPNPAGTPTYQYVQPQPLPDQIHQQPAGTLQQPYYPPQSPALMQQSPALMQQSPIGQQQQPYYGDQQPQTQQQQPYYGNQQPQVQQQQPYYAEQQPQVQQQQPTTYVYAQEHTTTEMPVVSGNGRGIVGRMPQLQTCCMCFPLHTGALIIAALMFIFYGYCGLVLLLASGYSGGIFVGLIIIGIFYLLVAVVSGYGFAGIYKEQPLWVDKFIRFYLIGSVVWFVFEVLEMILRVVYINQYIYYGGFPWAAWIIQLILASLFQYYFCVCLVSYQRVLHARVGDEKQLQMS